MHWNDGTHSDKHTVCSACANTIYTSNYIRTTKYTVLTFLPVVGVLYLVTATAKTTHPHVSCFCTWCWCCTLFCTPQNLFQQFLKVANFYFLVIAVLSFTPFSPKTPLVSIVPLVFVLSVTAVKEALEDYVSDGSC